MSFPFLDELEKLIVEHGSAVVSKERLELAKEKYSALEVLHEQKIFKLTSTIEALESDKISLQSNCQNLLREIEAYKNDLHQSEERIRKLEKQLIEFIHGNPKGYVCDKCGSRNLKQSGNTGHPFFGSMGIKMSVFKCEECGHKSSFSDQIK